MSVLAMLEHRGGAWNRLSFETIAAAQQLGRELGQPVSAALFGHSLSKLASDLDGIQLSRLHSVEHPLLESYTADGYTAAAAQLIGTVAPHLVLFPHTYQVRDFAPKLATRLGRALVSDVTGIRLRDGQLVLRKQFLQGKLNGELGFLGSPPYFASLQAGIWQSAEIVRGASRQEAFTPEISE